MSGGNDVTNAASQPMMEAVYDLVARLALQRGCLQAIITSVLPTRFRNFSRKVQELAEMIQLKY